MSEPTPNSGTYPPSEEGRSVTDELLRNDSTPEGKAIWAAVPHEAETLLRDLWEGLDFLDGFGEVVTTMEMVERIGKYFDAHPIGRPSVNSSGSPLEPATQQRIPEGGV